MDEAAPETITQIVHGNEEFSTLLQAVGSAGLAETLSGDGPFTVFAPTDDAFAALPEGTLQSLLAPDQQDQLAGILTYHVVPAEVPASEVTSGDVETVNGANLTVSVEDGTVTLEDGQGNEALVTQTDIEASNGVIHVIDAVLLPPSA
ncbi:MAG TPA: fasciclin domain-containing protein [Actinomycetota bacterium]